jgi:hypothetical protein
MPPLVAGNGAFRLTNHSIVSKNLLEPGFNDQKGGSRNNKLILLAKSLNKKSLRSVAKSSIAKISKIDSDI